MAPAGATVHPLWVQIALNATAVPAVGWATKDAIARAAASFIASVI